MLLSAASKRRFGGMRVARGPLQTAGERERVVRALESRLCQCEHAHERKPQDQADHEAEKNQCSTNELLLVLGDAVAARAVGRGSPSETSLPSSGGQQLEQLWAAPGRSGAVDQRLPAATTAPQVDRWSPQFGVMADEFLDLPAPSAASAD